MRTLSFVIACVLVVAGVSTAGSAEGSLPGAGTFSYFGPAAGNGEAGPVVVAAW